MKHFVLAFVVGLLALLAVIAFWDRISEPAYIQSRAAPEIGTGFRDVSEVRTKEFMVVTANRHASEAARSIIEQGGSAVDGAIAAQMMLTLVEPQSSGLGGGAFLLYWDQLSQKLQSFDGRETAPSAVSESLFLRDDGSALGFGEAVRSGRSIGVPGVIAMLWELHKQHGKLPWADLFAPAIAKAQQGFNVSPRLHKMLARKGAAFFNKDAKKLFYDENTAARPLGWLLKNPALAASFKTIARLGAKGFYQGPLAKAIIETAQKTPSVPSLMSLDDLQSYRAVERAPVCGGYHKWKVCGMGPPSSGGLTVAMILGLLERKDLGKAPGPQALHLIGEAEKLAYADRNRYMADPDFIPQPKGFLDPGYLKQRAALIQSQQAIKKALPGQPPLAIKSEFGVDHTTELGGTSHISIVDKEGNVVSMTSSIEGAFGSGQMTNGFLLNNQLTDFSFHTKDKDGVLIANRVQPLKRPRSSMSPTIVFDGDGKPHIVLGSPGGSRIILFVTKALIAYFDWNMGPQDAVGLFNFGSRNGPFELEKRTGTQALISQLEALGQTVRSSVMTSGGQMIVIEKNGLIGGTDPRREGAVLGR